ncbi:pilus assembly protein [Zavarzinia compransoris]|uniref:TadE/TadG family type IV pilus assembly protein n=1 Tax=Zavarzinia marina TaxID=2911065 RepID=UPI001F2F5E04|nr:TadE/TadG family type IV pilus assembly protein [Zavarzinia marina]MCF4166430.1 pilus assembly protein [Zavarzinia marina]
MRAVLDMKTTKRGAGGRALRHLGERGVAMIEFAFAAIIMVTIVLGILTYGEILANYIQLKYAVGELSRQIATGTDAGDSAARFTRAEAQVKANSGFADQCVVFESSGFSGQVTVTGTYDFGPEGCRMMPVFLLPTPDTVTAENTFTAL